MVESSTELNKLTKENAATSKRITTLEKKKTDEKKRKAPKGKAEDNPVEQPAPKKAKASETKKPPVEPVEVLAPRKGIGAKAAAIITAINEESDTNGGEEEQKKTKSKKKADPDKQAAFKKAFKVHYLKQLRKNHYMATDGRSMDSTGSS